MNTETTLITDASTGIGYHLAREFAEDGHPLVIVATDEEQLQNVPGVPNKVLVVARRVLTEGAQAKMNRKFYEEVPAGSETRVTGEIKAKAESA